MAKQRKHNFVIGYIEEGNVVYGKDNDDNTYSFTTPLTLFQAERNAKKMSNKDAVIFKLVALKTRFGR